MGEKFEVESGSSDNDGAFAAFLDLADDRGGEGFVASGITGLLQ